MSVSYKPAESLLDRTFIGLLVAQFLAAFNDQAIHASAMFFAIHQHYLSEADAISLMPILFYAPWAIFCTLAGYLADRYSKRNSLIGWKFAEVAITLIALVGFWLGTQGKEIGAPLVLSTVFLMGMHSAFFVPAKYGAMPEILRSHLLSRGNGLLESLSFLAVILGTVLGGVLTFLCLGREYIIGLVLVVLAIVGALASLLIRPIPVANPDRPFPRLLYLPIWDSLRQLFGSRKLRMAVLGIAFFTFIVAFMRATVYMHGESRIPRWPEIKTSAVVGVVALGIGLGSPLAGFISGRKVQLGLVPIGAIGMIAATMVAAYGMNSLTTLLLCIVSIGFFTGFYIVPLFTLLQHRAPKTSKGDAIATSNFINVTGAILASLLFFGVVFVAQKIGVAPAITLDDVAEGELVRVDQDKFQRPKHFSIRKSDGTLFRIGDPNIPRSPARALAIERGSGNGNDEPEPEEMDITDKRLTHEEITGLLWEDIEEDGADDKRVVVDVGKGVHHILGVQPNGELRRFSATKSKVVVSTYTIHNVRHYQLRLEGHAPDKEFNNERLPGFLFVGIAILTLSTLVILWCVLPSLLRRTWLMVCSPLRKRRGLASRAA